jgi:DNA ligase-associated metallophosphoesterase
MPDAPASGAGSPLRLNDIALLADVSGALVWEAARTVIVADLHLEKASGFAARGQPLPPYDTGATLSRLEAVIDRYAARRVLCLGDSFHDPRAAARLSATDAQRLCALTARVDWIWIAGNHDPAPPQELGGQVIGEVLTLGALSFRHIAAPDPAAGEVSGHYHPKASLWVRGQRISGRCFLADRRRAVLPAFGALAGGLDARDPALTALFPTGCDAHIIGRSRVTAVPSDRLGCRA